MCYLDRFRHVRGGWGGGASVQSDSDLGVGSESLDFGVLLHSERLGPLVGPLVLTSSKADELVFYDVGGPACLRCQVVR